MTFIAVVAAWAIMLYSASAGHVPWTIVGAALLLGQYVVAASDRVVRAIEVKR